MRSLLYFLKNQSLAFVMIPQSFVLSVMLLISQTDKRTEAPVTSLARYLSLPSNFYFQIISSHLVSGDFTKKTMLRQ